MNLEAIVALVKEVPDNPIIWKTGSRSYTKEELIKELEEGTLVGKQYASDLLRVSRDFIKSNI